jgi:hypothetical protein
MAATGAVQPTSNAAATNSSTATIISICDRLISTALPELTYAQAAAFASTRRFCDPQPLAFAAEAGPRRSRRPLSDSGGAFLPGKRSKAPETIPRFRPVEFMRNPSASQTWRSADIAIA